MEHPTFLATDDWPLITASTFPPTARRILLRLGRELVDLEAGP
jgi:hypothetical protein